MFRFLGLNVAKLGKKSEIKNFLWAFNEKFLYSLDENPKRLYFSQKRTPLPQAKHRNAIQKRRPCIPVSLQIDVQALGYALNLAYPSRHICIQTEL